MIAFIQALISVHDINHGWKLNSNFLEANVINILLLLVGLIYVLRQFLGEALSKRQEKVLATIQEAEDQLEQARNRLSESKKQLYQSQIIISQIKKEATLTAQKVRQSILEQGKLDVQRLTDTGNLSITATENQIRKQIQEQIITLAIKHVFTKLKKEITSDMRTKLIDKSITQLGSKL